MRPSCRTQLWPFRPAWWVGHGLGSTVLIFLPPLSFPLPPSLPPFLLELGLSDAPWMRGGGASEQFTMFLFHLLVVSLALLSRWVSSLGGSDPPAFISHVAEHANPRAAVCGSQRAFGETWVCVLAVLDWSHSLDLLCTSYLFLKSIFSLLIIWNKVWSQETHQRSPKQRSHHPA